MVTARMVTATCAICGVRDATTRDEVDGREVAACASCTAEVADPTPPASTGERVVRMLQMSPGMDLHELAEALGETDEMAKARVSAALSRAVRLGLCRAEGPRCEKLYYPTPGTTWSGRHPRAAS